MREIAVTNGFKRDYRSEQRRDPRVVDALREVVEMLANDARLPPRLCDHPLKGEWKGFRDCHVRPDLVLIYEKVGDDTLTLARLGSHSELFG